MLVVMACQSQTGVRPPRPPAAEMERVSPQESQAKELEWVHEQNLEDTSRLITLSRELKWELAFNDRQVLSLATVKKMDDIERLIRKIRARVGKK